MIFVHVPASCTFFRHLASYIVFLEERQVILGRGAKNNLGRGRCLQITVHIISIAVKMVFARLLGAVKVPDILAFTFLLWRPAATLLY